METILNCRMMLLTNQAEVSCDLKLDTQPAAVVLPVHVFLQNKQLLESVNAESVNLHRWKYLKICKGTVNLQQIINQ